MRSRCTEIVRRPWRMILRNASNQCSEGESLSCWPTCAPARSRANTSWSLQGATPCAARHHVRRPMPLLSDRAETPDEHWKDATLPSAHGALALPAFLPDATLGVVRAVDAADLERAGIEAVVMNVFHLMQKPGSSTITSLGGLHRMAAWPHPIITDSGGFQAYSLIRQQPGRGSLSDRGISFQPEGADRKFQLTPEKSIQLQLA